MYGRTSTEQTEDDFSCTLKMHRYWKQWCEMEKRCNYHRKWFSLFVKGYIYDARERLNKPYAVTNNLTDAILVTSAQNTEQPRCRRSVFYINPRRAGGGAVLRPLFGFPRISKKRRRSALLFFYTCSHIFSTHVVKISDPGRWSGHHQVTSSGLTSEKV